MAYTCIFFLLVAYLRAKSLKVILFGEKVNVYEILVYVV